MSQVLKQLFSADIQKNLYPDNSPFKRAKLDIGVQADVENVEVPQAGAMPAIVENPSSFPLNVVERTDDKKSYPVDLAVSPPVRIREHDNARLTYSKNQDVTQDIVNGLQTRIGDKMGYVWSPSEATQIVRTTGSASPALLTGATGTRKDLALEDIIEAMRILDNQEVPSQGRIILLSADLHAQMITAGLTGFVGADKLSSDLIKQGVVGTIFGAKIYKRSRTCRYTNDGTPVKKSYTAANAGTDNDSALVWHPSYVRMAEGTIKLFLDKDSATHLGDIMSASVRAGGMIGRSDEKGVVSIVQAAGA